ncbi:hypothetical protein [uncultured Clostridium sp.]|uniref:hypothetical protein n=1 Tax=uncultured Clostridium sp. TaxID=59620 RepID=UPI0026025070|nr:hypothetical protein [uncultured Clostridium sp.]
MKVSFTRIVSLIAIIIISVGYALYLGLTIEEKVIASLVLASIPLITLAILFMDRGTARKVWLIVLMVFTILMIIIALTVIGFTGTFNQVQGAFSFKALGMIGLVFSLFVIAYIYLGYIQFREIKSKFYGKRRNLFS